jgi:hypothetical protein
MIGHTAGIYVNTDIDEVNIFESTQAGNFGKSGVQVNTASQWFNKYPGKVYVRHLLFDNRYFDWTDYQLAQGRSNTFIRLTRKMPYPDIKSISGRWKLILSALDLYTPGGKDLLFYKGDDQGVFCTMLIAAWYGYCGLLCYDSLTGHLAKALKFGQEFEPDDTRDIYGRNRLEKYLRKGLSLSSEIEIKV